MTFLDKPVRQIALETPGAIAIFDEYGVDFVDQGDRMLAQSLHADKIRNSLTTLKAAPRTEFGASSSDLVHEILGRYHRIQRSQFLPVIRAAVRVEYANSHHPDCPWGLAHQLSILTEELDAHQEKEEQGLFLALIKGPEHDMRFPIQRMMDEHDDMLDQLETIRRLAHNYVAPENASQAWRHLYKAVEKLDGDLRFHIGLENNYLFPRFMRDSPIAA